MRFDWYQATIDAVPECILDACVATLPGAKNVEELPRGGNGYTRSARVLDAAGDQLAFLLYGSKTAPANLRGTSSNAVPVADLARSIWPEHRVSRLDVCEDMSAPGLFQEVETTMRSIALAAGMESGLAFVPDVAEKGRTYRLGGNTSDVVVRLYEKGFEQLGKRQVTAADVDPHLVRLEIQYRPRRDMKRWAAYLPPDEIWGASLWSKDLAMAVMKLDVPRIHLGRRRQSDWDVAECHHRMQWAQHMLDGGRRIAENELGLVDPTLEDSVDAYLAQLRDDLLAHGRRKGAHAVSLRPAGAGMLLGQPDPENPFAIH